MTIRILPTCRLKFNRHVGRIFDVGKFRGIREGFWVLRSLNGTKGETQMTLEFWFLEFLRVGFAFGTCGLIIWFWYWMLDSIGTF